MGSTLSEPLEPLKIAAPPEAASPATPAPPAAPGEPDSPARAPLLNNCWSCRLLSGSGLIGAGLYVYWVARRPMKLGHCFLGYSGPDRPQREGLSRCLKVPPVNLSSAPARVIQSKHGVYGRLYRHMNVDGLQYYGH
ncbi:distal membrane-arm assembly complex protein 1 isoform X1 [Oryctolagus cuniculus]|uniref:distal membrane-arm assembly complex protein 1 isoform X1 n=1 Tax=Oryctolagus cuniculus TaxID=9986 RepID=UPI00387A469B